MSDSSMEACRRNRRVVPFKTVMKKLTNQIRKGFAQWQRAGFSYRSFPNVASWYYRIPKKEVKSRLH